MKKFNFLCLVLIGFLIAFSNADVKAQDEISESSNHRRGGGRRPNLLQQLDLSPEQVQQLRQITAEKKPLMREAQVRLREANQNLDQAIYADNTYDSDIQTRIKDVQEAQAKLTEIRSTNELAIRRILTATQLVKFRQFRQQFMQKRNNRQNFRRERRNDSGKPLEYVPNRTIKSPRRLPRAND
jgi:Spy/CpxP family protein refolding chaperone